MTSWRSHQSWLQEAWSCWQLLWCCFNQCHWAAHGKWTSHKEQQDTSDVTQAKKNIRKYQWPLRSTKAFLPRSPLLNKCVPSSSGAVHLPSRGALFRKRVKNHSTAAKMNSHSLPKYWYLFVAIQARMIQPNLHYVGWDCETYWIDLDLTSEFLPEPRITSDYAWCCGVSTLISRKHLGIPLFLSGLGFELKSTKVRKVQGITIYFL